MRKICFITGTRAEYGIMSGLIKKVQQDNELQLQIIATNMHLSPEYGMTYKEIEADGFYIDKKVEMLLSSDTDAGTIKSMGVELIGMADALGDLNPNLIVILGDRYEMLMAATAAMIMKIPVAHLYGGEVTEGAYDDNIRHAITKLSHLHFTSTQEYRKHIIQMGENPSCVYWVGALGADNIHNTKLMPREELEQNLNFNFGEHSMLITYHPVTMEKGTAEDQTKALLLALNEFPEYSLLFTYPNSDGGGRIIRQLIDGFCTQRSNAKAFASLGRLRYFSSLRNVDVVVGNSSSGLAEAPCFGIPTLNIGDRQKGRAQGTTIINCLSEKQSIVDNLHKALSEKFKLECKSCDCPYVRQNTLNSIFDVIKEHSLDGLIRKHFYHIKF